MENEKENPNHDNDSLSEPLDILTVDSQYRITITRYIKEILDINKNDRIIVYRNRYNREILIFKVERNGSIVSSLTLVQEHINSEKTDEIFLCSNNRKKTIKLSSPVERDNAELYQTPILLVDDEKDVVDYFEELLKSEGYENIQSFSDSKEVLKYLDISKFIVAVLDIRMPDINGIQLYNILKILNPDIKILFTTALDCVNELTSLMMNVNPELDVLKKPIAASEFIKKVTNKIKMPI